MFETFTHKQEESHTLHEWKVGIQQNPFNLKTRFCFVSQILEIWSLMRFFIYYYIIHQEEILISAGNKILM